jgi:hypothetical protein
MISHAWRLGAKVATIIREIECNYERTNLSHARLILCMIGFFILFTKSLKIMCEKLLWQIRPRRSRARLYIKVSDTLIIKKKTFSKFAPYAFKLSVAEFSM